MTEFYMQTARRRRFTRELNAVSELISFAGAFRARMLGSELHESKEIKNLWIDPTPAALCPRNRCKIARGAERKKAPKTGF